MAATFASRVVDPEKLFALHIDHGLNRENESQQVVGTLRRYLGMKHFLVEDWSEQFLAALAGVEEPEEKRRIIGDLFVRAQRAVVERLGLPPEETVLVQGTLYTDTIESGRGVGKKADRIKLHHNVASPLIQEMREKGRLVEPNKDWYKDEVRRVGLALGLPEEIVYRHPFPGPGLGVRLINQSSPAWPEDREEFQSRLAEIAKRFDAEAELLPLKTVGVQGDGRTYRNLALVRARDYKTARLVGEEALREVSAINRVVWLYGDGEINFSPLELNRQTLDLLREIDGEANEVIQKNGLYRKISQMPVILFPGNVVAIRDVYTEDYMTVHPLEKPGEFPEEAMDELHQRLVRSGKARALVFDVTDKPPGTIEWQ